MSVSRIKAVLGVSVLIGLAACSGNAGSTAFAPGSTALAPADSGGSMPGRDAQSSVMFSGSHALIEDGQVVPNAHVLLQHRVTGSEPTVVGAAVDDVFYHNGRVQTFPAIGLVYWGFGTTGDPDSEIPRLDSFLKHLRASAPMNVVTQYYEIENGSKSYIPNYPAMSIAVWHDDVNALPPHGPKDKAIQAEALRAAAYFNFDLPGIDNLIIVATPHGLPMNYAACAYHGKAGNITYTNLPYQPDFGAGCGANSVNLGPIGKLDGVTETAIHEINESMSDPFFGGWLDKQGNEIGDKCQQFAKNESFDGEEFAVQPLWSNATGGCAY